MKRLHFQYGASYDDEATKSYINIPYSEENKQKKIK